MLGKPPLDTRVECAREGGVCRRSAVKSEVKRFYSAPPLPYGSEADVPEPQLGSLELDGTGDRHSGVSERAELRSVPPQSGIPLGLTVPSPWLNCPTVRQSDPTMASPRCQGQSFSRGAPSADRDASPRRCQVESMSPRSTGGSVFCLGICRCEERGQGQGLPRDYIEI